MSEKAVGEIVFSYCWLMDYRQQSKEIALSSSKYTAFASMTVPRLHGKNFLPWWWSCACEGTSSINGSYYLSGTTLLDNFLFKALQKKKKRATQKLVDDLIFQDKWYIFVYKSYITALRSLKHL